VTDEHACRTSRVTYKNQAVYFRIVCRCGYEGPLRNKKDDVRLDRMAHKEESASSG